MQNYSALFVSLALSLGAACAGPPGDPVDAAPVEAATSTPDASDGPPQRLACSANFGAALAPSYERIDGRLVTIVAPADISACRTDPDHVHLQVLVGGAVYDIAVTASSSDPTMPEVFFHVLTVPPPGDAFAEGSHPAARLDYVALGVHSSDFTPYPEAQLVTMLEAMLADVDHISIFATGYAMGDGAHLVHRNGHGGTDGALVLHPLAQSSPVLLFHFGTQVF